MSDVFGRRRKLAVEIHVKATHSLIPLSGIVVSTNTGYKTKIASNGHHNQQSATNAVKEALTELRLKQVPTKLLHDLLDAEADDSGYVRVRDSQIITVCNQLHEHSELQLDYDKLKEDWGEEFDRNAKFVNENGVLMMAFDTAVIMLEKITTRFGAPIPNFTKSNVVEILRNYQHALSSSINGSFFHRDQFGVVAEQCIRKLRECIVEHQRTKNMRLQPAGNIHLGMKIRNALKRRSLTSPTNAHTSEQQSKRGVNLQNALSGAANVKRRHRNEP